MNNYISIDGVIHECTSILIKTPKWVFNPAPFRRRRLVTVSKVMKTLKVILSCGHTIDASVVWLNKGLLDLSVLHNERVALAAVVSKDRGAVKGHIESLGEFTSRVTKEADLYD